MSDFIGRFYFKLTANGNLLGEYSNNSPECVRSTPEAAKRIADAPNPNDQNQSAFVGDYISTWSELTNDASYSKLVIRPKPGCFNIFKVNWTGPAEFQGEAMLCDEILIGDYRPGTSS